MYTVVPDEPLATGTVTCPPDSQSPTSHHPDECARRGTLQVKTLRTPSGNSFNLPTPVLYNHNDSSRQGHLKVSFTSGGPPGGAAARLEAASVMEAWRTLAAKKSTATSSTIHSDHLHETLRQSLAVGGEEGSGNGSLKPKRRLDRDYSQPGKFRGVRYRGKGRYSAELKVKEVRRWLGIFATAEEAARAFDKAAFEARGKEARLNFPELIEGAEVHRSRDEVYHGGEDENIDDEDDALTPRCDSGPQSFIPPAMAGKKGKSAGNKYLELQCDEDPGGADDMADDIIAEGWKPISPRHHDGLFIRQGSRNTRLDEGGGLRAMGRHESAYVRKDSMKLDEGERNAMSADDARHPSPILQHHIPPSRHPPDDTYTSASHDSHKVAPRGTRSHAATCPSPSPLPPNFHAEHHDMHPHTHPQPENTRPSLTSDLLADPLTLPLPSLTFPRTEPTSNRGSNCNSKHSPVDHWQPQHSSAASRSQAQAQMLLMQQLKNALAANSGRDGDGRSLPGEVSGGTAGKLDGLLLQALPALLRGEWNTGTGTSAIAATGSSSSSSRGGGEIQAASASGSGTHHRLPATVGDGVRTSSSTGNLNLLDSSDCKQGRDDCSAPCR